MLSINNEYGRKEQSYKEVIEKLMASLTLAQKQNESLQFKLGTQMQAIIKGLKNQVNHQKLTSKSQNTIKKMAEEIMLRQENSMISSKSGD